MKLVTASQMRAIDQISTEKFGVPSLDLMENAGRAVAEFVQKKFPKKGFIAVIVGKGNNGGDGLVAARYLKEAGFDVTVYLLSSWTEFSKPARINWEHLATTGVNAAEITTEQELKDHSREFEKAVCIIDAIFGTGLTQTVSGKYKTAIEMVNALSNPVVAIDIPSGLSADTGEPLGVAIRAKYTVTFGMMKVGLVTSTGHEYAKDVQVVDIGIPKSATDGIETGHYLITKEMFSECFVPRPERSHKGDYGHVLVIGGSTGKIGAGLLSAKAALRSGAGLVTYALPKTAFSKFDTRSPEVMYASLPDKGLGFLVKDSLPELKKILRDKDVVAIGPGIGTEDDTKNVAQEIVSKSSVPIVVDADALNCLAGNLNVVNGKKYPLIFTPHPGEMSRLAGCSVNEVQTNRIAVARSFAKTHHLYLILKGHRTTIATPTGEIFINPTGSAAMATAGMGDVLTGVIAGFIAQKITIEKALLAAVYLHGLAGEVAAKEIGERGLLASDVISAMPKAIRSLAL